MLHILLGLLITIPTLLVILVSVLYFHFGIDGWEDLTREVRILKFKVAFFWSQASIQRGNVNYVNTWKSSVAKFGNLVFLEKGKTTYTYSEVTLISRLIMHGSILYKTTGCDETRDRPTARFLRMFL